MSRDQENNAARPADVLRDGNLKASIWRNEGESGPFYATSFARTYRDEEGRLHDTNSFVAGDLLKLSELARSAYTRTNALRREDRQQERPQEREESREAFKERRTQQSRRPAQERERSA